ncbi:chitosanase [Pendulispora rubella]|uniref:chitosanase n=1 Tax=Pendulispora rubella TaxID=2741070 RepID=UPI00374E1A9F
MQIRLVQQASRRRSLLDWARPCTMLSAVLAASAMVVGCAQAEPEDETSSQEVSQEVAAGGDLNDPRKKEIAMEIVSSAENSSLDWKKWYGYIEPYDWRGYTAGIIGFCSGTGDMLDLVEYYKKIKPGNILEKYLPALRKVNGTSSLEGLKPNFESDWKKAAKDSAFQRAQNDERDRVYFNPAVSRAKQDGLGALGQFIYYDAIVMHGNGGDPLSFPSIRKNALKVKKSPAQGGDEVAYLHAFLDARVKAMKAEPEHGETDRVDTEQRVFLKNGNLDLHTPLVWKVYGDTYRIDN